MKQELMRMRDIDKSFPGVHALKDANFSLNAGEIHALIGENGAGKSTLMNVLIGAIRPDRGEIQIKGVPHVITSPNYAIRHGIGIVPQELNIVPDISVAENIFLGISNTTFGMINWKETYKKAAALIENLGCTIDVKSLAGEHNVAELQMVQIARALAFGAEIIIFDEPTASLTYQETRALFRIINRLKTSGAGIIFISHHLEEVAELSDRVTVMRDGEVVGTYATAETTESQLISLMAGQAITFSRIKRNYQSEDIVLRVSNLCHKSKFSDVSFSVKRGEIFGFGGLVGAGRSEVAQTVFGYLPLEQGSIVLNGKEICPRSPYEAIQAGIGYVPEERRQQAIFPELSIRENLTMPILRKLMKHGKINRKQQEQITGQYIADLKIRTTSTEKKICELSGGNQQKVILSRWMVQDLQVLILDEPTRGIDVKAKEEIHNIIRQLADGGLTVVVISSEMEELINLCDRIMVMQEGRVKGIVAAEGMTAKDILDIALS